MHKVYEYKWESIGRLQLLSKSDAEYCIRFDPDFPERKRIYYSIITGSDALGPTVGYVVAEEHKTEYWISRRQYRRAEKKCLIASRAEIIKPPVFLSNKKVIVI